MNGYLLDVNVLVALSWPTHVSHNKAAQWFATHSRQGWATCPFTQSSFVRILSNRAFSPEALTVSDATRLLLGNLEHASHKFWADDLSFWQAVEKFSGRLVGHQQVTDAYLLGLVLHKKGKFATLDTGILALVPEDSSYRSIVEIIN